MMSSMDTANLTTTSRILEPGLRKYMPYGMERYQVPSMGTIVVTLTPGAVSYTHLTLPTKRIV